MPHSYLTTAIPYVNSSPHVGFALELVQADILARHRRHRGHDVRLCSGTDDNSLKNVQAAEAEGITTAALVERNAAAFRELADTLTISLDDFIQTSSDTRHRRGVDQLWRHVADSGDLYTQHYEGLYCVGCEQFYNPSELDNGLCPEHQTAPQQVAERNWFFRLSRYAEKLAELIDTGALRIEPETRRNEVRSFIAQGLQDFSVSRSVERARGWGIGVPDDDTQVIYVWFDALINYITALDYGGDDPSAYRTWWHDADEIIHVIGKGITRFHAVYWPAMLLSAGQPLPDVIYVHDYLTASGRKLGKSLGNAVDPNALVETYGLAALRWWLARDVPRTGDADFTPEKLVTRYNTDLANGLGNLVNRIATMIHRYRDGQPPTVDTLPDNTVTKTAQAAPGRVDDALARFDIRTAVAAVVDVVEHANRYIVEQQPWVLAKDPDQAATLDGVLAVLVDAVRVVADELTPFLPTEAARVMKALARDGAGRIAPAEAVFPRIDE